MYRRTILRAPIQLDGITLSTVPFESAREQTKTLERSTSLVPLDQLSYHKTTSWP